MEQIKFLIDLFLHLDTYMANIINQYGVWTYGLLFFVIFMETGFVVTPFLPGDSLIFAAGTFAAIGSLNVWLLLGLLMIAAVGGDTINYWIGHYLGDRAYNIKWIKREYLDRTHAFFQKHGGKTIFLARFVPIVRTFAPAVAGVAEMNYRRFVSFNVFGGILWVCSTVLLGFFMGRLIGAERLNRHIHLVIIVVVFLSILPGIIEYLRARAKRRDSAPTAPLAQAETEEK